MTTACFENETEEETSLEFLVEAAQAGDREAFGELATRFEPMVYAIAVRRLGNHAEAQELCQEVLVKAMQKNRAAENSCRVRRLVEIHNRPDGH